MVPTSATRESASIILSLDQWLISNQVPDLICGDMDSARPEILQYFENLGVQVAEDKDQDSTDLMKSLAQITRSDAKRDVLVYGSLGGRADQAFSQLHQLYLTSATEPHEFNDVLLVAGSSLIIVLKPGQHQIETPVHKGGFSEYAGIVPLTGPATVTTEGFEWNLHGEELAFGRFISTSNHITSDTVKIDTSSPVVFTLEFD